MNITDDVLNLVLKSVKPVELLTVCKKWHDIIIKNIKKCHSCNKIIQIYDDIIWTTQEGDMDCHMYSYQTKTHKSVEIELKEIEPLKILFANLENIYSNEINISFENNIDGKFMKINEIDPSKTNVIDVIFNKGYFNKFNCIREKVTIGVNVHDFNEYLNNYTNDCVHLSIYHNELYLTSNNKKSIPKKFRLIDIAIQGCKSPKTTFDMSCKIDLKEFTNTCNEFPEFNNSIKIECSFNKISFISNNKTKSYEQSELVTIDTQNTNNIFSNEYDLKKLLLSNYENYCNNVKIFMKTDYPICILYKIKEYGKIIIYTVPYFTCA
jgi:hypothetical protein